MDQPAATHQPVIDAGPTWADDAFGNRLVGLSPRFWLLIVLTGVGAGVGAGALMLLLRAVQHLCYSYSAGAFLDGVQQAPAIRRVVVVFCAGMVVAGGVFLLSHGRGGSGGKLNERIWFHSGRLAEAKTILQSALSITIVGMGASLGRETAPKQTGAAIASWLSRWTGLTSAESRFLAACGAGAGMGAVYNVPFGGALFALEVLLGTVRLALIPPALTASFIATAVSWLMLPNQPTYAFAVHPVPLTLLIWAVAFGPLAGVASVLFIRLVARADAPRPNRGPALVLPIITFAGLALLAIPYPQLLGNGKDVTQLAFNGSLALPLLLALLFLKPLVTVACLGSGAPGGLFTPTITMGAMLGDVLGRAWSVLWPGADAGSFAMIGATAVLAAAMQAPIAATVLMIELTRNLNTLMVPILIAVTGAALTARGLDARSIYTGRVHTGRQAAESGPPPAKLPYLHLLLPQVRTISIAANFSRVLERLLANPRPLYVLDENARFVGRIEPRNAASASALTQILSIAAAGDIMEWVEPLTPSLSEREALNRLAAEPTGELPVVENGRLLGVAARP